LGAKNASLSTPRIQQEIINTTPSNIDTKTMNYLHEIVGHRHKQIDSKKPSSLAALSSKPFSL
jgi:hypothetical protein